MGCQIGKFAKSKIVRTSNFPIQNPKKNRKFYFSFSLMQCLMMDYDGLALHADIDITQLKLTINRLGSARLSSINHPISSGSGMIYDMVCMLCSGIKLKLFRVVMPRRCLSLPVSRATSFHIIYQHQAERIKLGRVLPNGDGPPPFITSVNKRPSLSALGRFFDSLLATLYLFGDRLMLSD